MLPSSHWSGVFVCFADGKYLAFCVPARVDCAAFEARKKTQTCAFIHDLCSFPTVSVETTIVSPHPQVLGVLGVFLIALLSSSEHHKIRLDDFLHTKTPRPGQDQSFSKPQLIQTNSAHPLLSPIDLYLVGFWDFPACRQGPGIHRHPSPMAGGVSQSSHSFLIEQLLN